MAEPCITCGGRVGELRPEVRRAKERLGLPLTPPKRCDECVWASLLAFADAPDEEPTESNGTGEKP